MEKEIHKSDAALREEKVLEFWSANNIFQKSMDERKGEKEFIFYEGPPTANGKPGIHHLEARAFKDAIPRYKTMRGYHVRRKGGWDTHGLPVELQVEKKLGLNSKKAIEEYGIAKFNQDCKESVWEYLDIWNKFTKRIGYWVDQEHPYVTYENNYIESVWNVVKKVNEQELLYKDYRIVPWCSRCGTALSSHELAQGYETVKDLSVYAKFKVIGMEQTYILAWTTTPWTLPGNIALAVGKDIEYVKIKSGDEFWILAESRLSVIAEEYKIVEKIKGSDMVGWTYEPLFPFLADTISEAEKPKLNKAFHVYAADFVTTEDGTGVVHTAVMYGQDDFVLGTQLGLPKHHLVNPEGKFIEGTGFIAGRFVKETDGNGKPTLAIDIIDALKANNYFYKKENFEHSYPHCWRCHTALIYYARDSWYIRMSDSGVKKKMIEENKSINWEPEHTREGRFGEWLKEIKDWAISRERYWGTPLPVWHCKECDTRAVIGSVEELKKRTKKSGNNYFVMRHGQSTHNLKWGISSNAKNTDSLTDLGKKEVREAAEKLKDKKIDLIIMSPFLRTEQTASIVREVLGLSEQESVIDERLVEFGVHSFEGKTWKEYHEKFPKTKENFSAKIDGDESYFDVKKRAMAALYDAEKQYIGKNILFITHGAPAWLMSAGAQGIDLEKTYGMIGVDNNDHLDDMKNAEVRELEFTPLPHNEHYELDLHRPYIDEVSLVCEKGHNLIRTKEVMDVWFDSGAMPFAQDHYPFENKEWVDGPGYPADYICEAIDQTRGWFYTLHAVGILMGRGKAYKNVICLGHLLDAKGKKMSKSIGNVVDPWEATEKYGVDTLRMWMYGVNQPGESKNFDEKTVVELHRQVFGLLYNVLAFYELYRDKTLEANNKEESKNILDIWILARLNELVDLATRNMDNYKLLEPTRAIREFMSDLSTWYLRRSRERIKDGDTEAKQTLYFALKTLSKIMAPFAPFTAEDLWLALRNESDKESVHLTMWPEETKINTDALENMKVTREIVSLGLEARQKAKIQVRQPLSKLEIRNNDLKEEYFDLIRDEVNIKEVVVNESLDGDVSLNIELTPELRHEGDYRELVRSIQDMRKKQGLTPSDAITLIVETDKAGHDLVKKFESDLLKTVLASNIEFDKTKGEDVKIGELVFKIKIN